MDEAQKQAMAEAVARIRENMTTAAKAAGRDPGEVLLCAACKTRTVEEVRYSADLPIDLFGENHVQELVEKTDAGAYNGKPGHFIGHLQTNKVNKVVGKVDLIHSVDSERLLRAIDRQADRLGLVQDVLLEVNVAGELSKGGCTPDEAWELAQLAQSLEHVRLRGLMAIPPIAQKPGDNTPYFSIMKKLYVDIKEKIAHNQDDMDCLSMGMSGDYEDAIAQGATLVRVGTALFGPRPPMAKQ